MWRGPTSNSWLSCLEMSKWSVWFPISFWIWGRDWEAEGDYTLRFGWSRCSRLGRHFFGLRLGCRFLRKNPSGVGCTIAWFLALWLTCLPRRRWCCWGRLGLWWWHCGQYYWRMSRSMSRLASLWESLPLGRGCGRVWRCWAEEGDVSTAWGLGEGVIPSQCGNLPWSQACVPRIGRALRARSPQWHKLEGRELVGACWLLIGVLLGSSQSRNFTISTFTRTKNSRQSCNILYCIPPDSLFIPHFAVHVTLGPLYAINNVQGS